MLKHSIDLHYFQFMPLWITWLLIGLTVESANLIFFKNFVMHALKYITSLKKLFDRFCTKILTCVGKTGAKQFLILLVKAFMEVVRHLTRHNLRQLYLSSKVTKAIKTVSENYFQNYDETVEKNFRFLGG